MAICVVGLLSYPPAVVPLLDELRDVAREARTRRVEDTATRLAEETEEDLRLEALNTLEAAEQGQQTPHAPHSVIDKRGKNDAEQAAGPQIEL